MRHVMIFVLCVIATGCANEPIIDTKAVDTRTYRQDMSECRAYTEKVDTTREVTESVVKAVTIGAVYAGIFGNRELTERIAGASVVGGGLAGATRAEQRKEKVHYKCMEGRGYRVLG